DIYSSRIAAVEAGDLDLDGDIDLLVQDILLDDILWLENTAGDGSAWTQIQIASFPAARPGLQAVDLDFDGDLDVVGDPNANWWENIDKATSWTRRSYSDAADVNDTVASDLDGDGDRDIAVARNVTGQVSWFENLTCSPADADADSDGVRDGCDVCPGFDDRLDADGDLTPDGCDACPGFDDRVDNDGDGVPDACPSFGSISIDDVTLPEGDSGQAAFTFTISFSGDVAGGFTVGYATRDQSAIAGDDYAAAAGTLSFTGADGEQQTITVQVLGDARVEAQEAFQVVLEEPSNSVVNLDDGIGVGTVFNDDTASIAIDDPSLSEGDSGNSPLTLTVTVTGAVDGGFSLDYFSEDGTATVAGNDYVPGAGTLSFAGVDGERQSITVQVVGDTTLEADERFAVQLLNPSNPAVLILDGTGRPTLLNDDEAALTVGDVSQAEADAGSTAFEFPVTLTGADVDGGFTVPYTTVDGT
ncbi:MAG: Calx-beta domain-containing protein, partial [Acidobacteriota bacterium]